MAKYNFHSDGRATSIEADYFEVDDHDNLGFWKDKRLVGAFPAGSWGNVREEQDDEATLLRNRVIDALGGERFEK